MARRANEVRIECAEDDFNNALRGLIALARSLDATHLRPIAVDSVSARYQKQLELYGRKKP